ncbi:lyso-ornithine lipid O-acyltransferase [Roseivivax sp.]
MTPWDARPLPQDAPPGPLGWLRVALRGLAMGTTVFGGLALLLFLRLIEAPIFGTRRPVTPWITQGVCRASLAILGLKVTRRGRPLAERGAMVANHSSWLDIFVLNAQANLYFVSKAEVSGWPGIGWLARATGTVFIARDRREASRQARLFETRLRHGHRLLFFPEGTSTDGRRVLPFKTTLFEAFLAEGLRHEMRLQAVSLCYHAPEGARADLYGWWGEMTFGGHLVQMLARRRHGSVTLVYHPPLRVDAYPNRKSLARALEAQVRTGFESAGAAPAPLRQHRP